MNPRCIPRLFAIACALLAARTALAQKVFLNPSNQFSNLVAGGGNEAEYAKINADLTAALLQAAGFSVVVDQDFYNAPLNANSWGADIFVSIHSNAGGGHGTVTLYVSSGGKVLASHVQAGLVAHLPYDDRGLSHRTDLYVLNKTAMYAALAEVVFHDCATQSGPKGHPPSESAFLKSAEGQQKIAAGLAAGICSYFGKTCGGGVVPPIQTGFFKGVVYRAPDMDDRIPGALVVLDTGQSVVANQKGYWEFELQPGTYTATAYADGYAPNSSTRTVTAGQDIWGSIGLSPLPAESDAAPDPGPADAPAEVPPEAPSEAPPESAGAEAGSDTAADGPFEAHEVVQPETGPIRDDHPDDRESDTGAPAPEPGHVPGGGGCRAGRDGAVPSGWWFLVPVAFAFWPRARFRKWVWNAGPAASDAGSRG